MTEQQPSRLEQLERALAAGNITQDTFDDIVAGMSAQVAGSRAVAQGEGASAVGEGGVRIAGGSRGNINTGREITASENAQIVYAEQGATVVIGDPPIEMTEVDRESVLGRYLQHLIAQNRYLQLQGIRSGGKLVNIELDRIYVTLRATRQPAQRTRVEWLQEEQAFAPGEEHRLRDQAMPRDTTQVTVNQALAEHRANRFSHRFSS
jgi:hypothetical protein